MRERTETVSWLEAASLAFPGRAVQNRRLQWLLTEYLPPPERAGPVTKTGPLTVAGPRRIRTGFL